MIFMSCNINIINNLSLSFITFFTAIKESQKLCDNGELRTSYDYIYIYMKLQVSIFANDSQQKKIKIYTYI